MISRLVDASLIVAALSFLIICLQRPSWELSAQNSPDGFKIEVYLSDRKQAVYTSLIPGKSIPSEFHRLQRDALPQEIASTTFFDDTLRPGRWTIQIAGHTLDIMEGREAITTSPLP